jgi:hypothetical protein
MEWLASIANHCTRLRCDRNEAAVAKSLRFSRRSVAVSSIDEHDGP